MQIQFLILIGLVIILASAFKQTPHRNKRAWSQHLKGWQKVLGPVSFVAVLLLMINPEFIALGLVGDTALFDLLVLALSIQMQTVITRAWQGVRIALTRAARWMGIPSPGLCYLVAVAALLFGSTVSSFQKNVQRLSS
jgi:uncharacterized membrane protein YkgB